MKIVLATKQDIPELISLMQCSFRGEKGWCRDDHLLQGPRVTREMLEKDLSTPMGILWKCVPETDEIENNVKHGLIMASVYTEKQAETNTLFVGRLCVHPDYQTHGLGKKLMKAAEERAKAENCSAISLQVLFARTNLIQWYERQGFRLTGEREALEDEVYGKFLVSPEMLDLVTLQKDL